MSDSASSNIQIKRSPGIAGFLQSLGVARVAAMGTVALGMVGFFVFLILRFNQPHLSVLYADLQFKDSVEIAKKLNGMNIPHEIRSDGTVILVPKDQVLKLRLTMAEQGLPSGGTVGYEIFDKGSTLGTTSFVQNINHLRAIEGELARTINALTQVERTRVHLVLPKRKLFSKDASKASASIVIKSRGSLDRGQIRAIQHLVSSAVEGLSPGQVSVVDENGRLLAAGAGESNEGPMALAAAEENRAYEIRLARDLEQILGRIVGPDHVRIRVNAEMDYNRVTKSSEVFDPDGRVVRSSNTREETSNSKQPTSDKTVTVGNELPNSAADKSALGNATENQEKIEEVVNYEISKSNQTEIIEGGRVKRLSVAVLVDGVYIKNAEGKPEYKPREKGELDQISTLVQSAIGFDEKRGDQVNVTNLQFATAEKLNLDGASTSSFFDLTKADYFYIAELTITLLISLFFILFVIRPLIKRVLAPEQQDIVIDLLEQNSNSNVVPIELDPEKLQTLEEVESQLAENKTAKNIQDAKLSGELHAEAISQIGALVTNNPKEATTIIRQWINGPQQV